MSKSKDYHATLKVQHGRLRAAMRELGIDTAAELSRRSGVSQCEIGELLNFKRSPRTKRGKWRRVVLKICKALGANPAELFPEHLDHEIPTNKIGAFVEYAQLHGVGVPQIGPAEECQRSETERIIAEALSTLSARERNVLKARFWNDETLEDAGRSQGVSGQTISLIEARALRKLRHPSRIKKLHGVCPFSHK